MPIPDFALVMAALRAGQRFQIGGGRSFATYAMPDGQLVVIESDDGFTQEFPCSEERLRSAIERDAEYFIQTLAYRERDARRAKE